MKISDAEWPILAVLWKESPIAASEVLPLITSKRFSTNLGTLRTHLRRMSEKGLVTQAREGKRHLYSTQVSRAKAVNHEVENLLANIPAESRLPALRALLRGSNLKESELKKLKLEIEKML